MNMRDSCHIREGAPGEPHLHRARRVAMRSSGHFAAACYPVPNPAFPFLGVHLTKTINGRVHAGPNAVLALRREGYRWRDIDLRDLTEILRYPGFQKLAAKYWRDGIGEMYRSASKRRFTRSLQELVPEIQASDLVQSPAGVRAQAVLRDGSRVEDFLVIKRPNATHVCNAPSPGATSSLEIAKTVVADL